MPVRQEDQDPLVESIFNDLIETATELGIAVFDHESIQRIQQIKDQRAENLSFEVYIELLDLQFRRTLSDEINIKFNLSNLNNPSIKDKFGLLDERRLYTQSQEKKFSELVLFIAQLQDATQNTALNLKINHILDNNKIQNVINTDRLETYEKIFEGSKTYTTADICINFPDLGVTPHKLGAWLTYNKTYLEEGSHYIRTGRASNRKILITQEGYNLIQERGTDVFKGSVQASSIQVDLDEKNDDQETQQNSSGDGDNFERNFLLFGSRIFDTIKDKNDNQAQYGSLKSRIITKLLRPLDRIEIILSDLLQSNDDEGSIENLSISTMIEMFELFVEQENYQTEVRRILGQRYRQDAPDSLIKFIQIIKEIPELFEMQASDYREHVLKLSTNEGTAEISIERLLEEQNLQQLSTLIVRLKSRRNGNNERYRNLYQKLKSAKTRISNSDLKNAINFIEDFNARNYDRLLTKEEVRLSEEIVAEVEQENLYRSQKIDSQAEILRRTLEGSLLNLYPVYHSHGVKGQKGIVITNNLVQQSLANLNINGVYHKERVQIMYHLSSIFQACDEVGINFWDYVYDTVEP